MSIIIIKGGAQGADQQRRKNMTRIENFGIFGGNLGKFADMNGFIPQTGDDLNDFNFPGDWEWEDGEWEEFVAEASVAITQAENALAEWRDQ